MLRSPGTRHTPKARRIWERLGGTSTSSSVECRGVAHLRYTIRTRGGCSYQTTIQRVHRAGARRSQEAGRLPETRRAWERLGGTSTSSSADYRGVARQRYALRTRGGCSYKAGVCCYCRRVIRQLRWIRGLRWKSLSRVWAEMSSTLYFSSSAGSSLKRRKLLEKYSTPPGASRAMAMSSSCTWSRCTSNTSSMRLELEKVGGSMKIRSYSPLSCSSHFITSSCTSWCRSDKPLSARLRRAQSR